MDVRSGSYGELQTSQLKNRLGNFTDNYKSLMVAPTANSYTESGPTTDTISSGGWRDGLTTQMSSTSHYSASTVSGTHSSGSHSTENTQTTKDASKSLNRRIAQRQVIYPAFEAAIDHTLDEFWRIRLMHAARDKFPRGFTYRDGFLMHRRKNKTASVPIPDDPAQVASTFINFMQQRGMLSDADVAFQNDQVAFELAATESRIPQTWSQVPLKVRESLLEGYMSRIAAACQLSPTHYASLRIAIFLGVKLKIFNTNRIVLRDYSIEMIEGLVREQDGSYAIAQHLWDSTYRTVTEQTACYGPEDDNTSQPLVCYRSDTVSYGISPDTITKKSSSRATYQHPSEQTQCWPTMIIRDGPTYH